MKLGLSIAGSDSSAGAGIQGDLKAFSANGVFSTSVITAVTAQNTNGVLDIEKLPIKIIKSQLDVILSDMNIASTKIGMLYNEEVVNLVAKTIDKYKMKNIVLDPVMISSSGKNLINQEGIKAIIKNLIPRVDLITPNLAEGEFLSDKKIDDLEDMKIVIKDIYKLGAKNILLKGGHLKDSPVDIFYNGVDFIIFEGTRINTKNTHGTGCALSSAISANLVKGHSLQKSIQKAKDYIENAIRYSLEIGEGVGPVNHFYFIK